MKSRGFFVGGSNGDVLRAEGTRGRGGGLDEDVEVDRSVWGLRRAGSSRRRWTRRRFTVLIFPRATDGCTGRGFGMWADEGLVVRRSMSRRCLSAGRSDGPLSERFQRGGLLPAMTPRSRRSFDTSVGHELCDVSHSAELDVLARRLNTCVMASASQCVVSSRKQAVRRPARLDRIRGLAGSTRSPNRQGPACCPVRAAAAARVR